MSDESDDDCTGSNPNREDQFAHVVQQTLRDNGELHKLKASMRSTIMKIVRGGDRTAIVKIKEKYHNSASDLVNNLIMDYFHWYGYQYSIEMFATESGAISTEQPNRLAIGERLGGNNEFSQDIMLDLPVILSIVMKILAEDFSQGGGDGICCLSAGGNSARNK